MTIRETWRTGCRDSINDRGSDPSPLQHSARDHGMTDRPSPVIAVVASGTPP
jgi:hypothetical protein